jgi:hypothetical protein
MLRMNSAGPLARCREATRNQPEIASTAPNGAAGRSFGYNGQTTVSSPPQAGDDRQVQLAATAGPLALTAAAVQLQLRAPLQGGRLNGPQRLGRGAGEIDDVLGDLSGRRGLRGRRGAH